MKALKPVLFGAFIALMVVSLSVRSYGQDNITIDEEKLANLIDSPRTKQILANKIDGYPGIKFDMSTLACDFFRDFVIVATVDFEHIPSGKHGTASFAYKWMDGEFVLIHTSYWLWGTVVSGDITSDATWNAAGSPYYVIDEIDVNPGVTLTIEPGTMVRFRKFAQYGKRFNVGGNLICDGATFTTSCDFEDYDASQISNVDWYGIWIYEDGGCTITNSLIEYGGIAIYGYSSTGNMTVSGCTIRKCYSAVEIYNVSGTCLIEDNIMTECDETIFFSYQSSPVLITGNTIENIDYYGWAGVYLYESTATLSSNDIRGGFYNGIYCTYNSSPDITLNTIQDNEYGIYAFSNSVPLVNNNSIMGNYYHGLWYDSSGGTLNAENNWWGDASGPYHLTLNPSGLGDAVSDGVDFDPWLMSAPIVVIPAI